MTGRVLLHPARHFIRGTTITLEKRIMKIARVASCFLLVVVAGCAYTKEIDELFSHRFQEQRLIP